MSTGSRSATGRTGWVAGGAAGLAVLAGLYLIAGPWVARFGGAVELAVSNTVAGLAIIALAAVRTRDPGPQALTWVLPVLGLWAAVSPLVLRYGDETVPSAGALVGNVIAGVVVIAAGLALLRRRRTSSER
ncbi:SPW repeat protein [Amycolatopsis sp. PS_44_ISF1]|uniref:SPW repeat domain-containing protein n=1 Tax=Amycolatopsis sp. PS_44_ISF1 TaxID=2974917 RepID=UPI0028DFD9FD|nr:SPW repeat protein [Amycolatopsis sp. PS_44_ISF1]MDT8912471.1 SPW repeat protein [Amycolatopsis sp. PS_44_ISF1]